MSKLIFLVAFIAVIFYSAEYVSAGTITPLLMWTKKSSSSGCDNTFTPSTLQTSETVFNDQLVECLLGDEPPTKVVLFVQNSLSVDTLRKLFVGKHTTESMDQLKKSMQSPNSVTLPAFELNGNPEENFSIFKQRNLDFEVVNLPDDLKVAADMIQRKLNSEQQNIVALWTSSSGHSDIELKRNRRAAATSGDSNSTKICLKNDCFAMCFSSIKIQPEGSEVIDLVPTDDTIVQTCSPGKKASFSKKFSKKKSSSGIIDNITLTMSFSLDLYSVSAMEWWTVESAQVTYTKDKKTVTSQLHKSTFKSLTAPRNWCFVCAEPPALFPKKVKGKSPEEVVSIFFENLQLQPFDTVKGTEFNENYVDCSGWVTTPILIGLLISFFIIMMLWYAFSMVSSITTMDRFDDPKGKGISVPQDS